MAELLALLMQSRKEAAAFTTEAAAARSETATVRAAFKLEVVVQQQTIVELSATIASQRQQLEKNKVTIAGLLAALRGKARERIAPNQLLMFEQRGLATLIREQAGGEPDDDAANTGEPRKHKRGHGRGLIPDNLPREEVLHELLGDQRLCSIDGQPMPVIRRETSGQLEYVPSQVKVLVDNRAVYAC